MIDYKKLSTYDYYLPENLIAQTPLEKRDESRLLVFDRKTKDIYHRHFKDITSFLKKGDVLVLNNTRVLPARLVGKKDTGASVEILLLKRRNMTDWEVLLKPAKRVKIGTILTISDELKCELLEVLDDGNRMVRFIFDGVFEDILDRVGSMPLPHYIHEKLKDKERYQTVYNKVEGSAAAPTAGLHFTNELLQKIRDMGVEILELTLDVGLGTFRPCKEDDITKHVMHTEHYRLSQEVADKINKAKIENRRVIAVGTTSVRTLETVAQKGMPLEASEGDTSIFIYPPYKFKVVDALITNFHLPKSTLIMLVSAFAGYENTMNIYETAVENQYRFFSFGDAMFIE
ncbi:MAG TPA: tRNA preQ1(34) S-adenosylmethionine ribosyltransferase-isomerase QueA [Candidatus Onthoplasma faecigallinarum]|nr:tRNA preQ1(34) S-adenosylmethionine ribosyltransferase-isomerase QueA [Candidatus Onthoplasma faecigallinarum]